MTTISIPISNELNDFINQQVKLGRASSKAELVRLAIKKFKENEFILNILEAEQEVRDGKVLTGDLDELARAFK